MLRAPNYAFLLPGKQRRNSLRECARLCGIYGLAACWLLASQIAHPQGTADLSDAETPALTDSVSETGAAVERKIPARQPVESELVVESLASYGNWRLFAGGQDCKLFTAGVEYDRHSWGYFLKARIDYAAEVLPIVVLMEPAKDDIWGDPLTTAKRWVPGLEISPIGFRMMWRSDKASWKPYFTAKGGILVFTQKVPSPEATYENFSFQTAIGVQTRLTERMDLRLGLFSDVHFSNAFIVPVNPGLDVMNANLGISYHLHRPPLK